MGPAEHPTRPSTHNRHKSRRRRYAGAACAGVLIAPLLAACGSSSGPPTINIYFGEQDGQFVEHAVATCNAQAGGRYTIKFQQLPSKATDQREQLVRRLAANDSSIDVIGMDVIWTAEFANAGWISPFPDSMRPALEKDVLAGPLKSGIYQGKLYAAPFTSNTQLLFYRKDLVPTPPANFTWDQMIDTSLSKKLYVAIQGKKAENIAVTFNSLLASAGGTWLTNADAAKNATVSLQQGPTSAALGVLAKLAKSPAADPELNTADESGSNTPFTSGKAGYQVNYPFVYKGAAPDLQSKIGFARWPRVDANRPSSPPLGGFNMGVGKFSKHKDLAFQVAACMRQPSNQLFATDKGGVPPTLKTLYPKLDRKTYPFADELESSINDAAARPVSPAYNDLSLAVQDVTSPFSAINPQKDAKKLRSLSAEALKSEAVL